MKKKFSILVIALSLLVPFGVVPSMVAAVDVLPICSGTTEGASGGVNAGSTDVCKSATSQSGSVLVTTLKTVFNILSFIIALSAVIVLIVGGMKLMVAQGDPSQVKSGRDTIIYALIGLAAAALAQVIVVFVLNRLK